MDDASLRNTKGIHARITRIRKDLVLRFEDVVAAAVISKDEDTQKEDIDRASSAVAQHQMQVSTAALIKAAEDMQSLIRQLQEIWLFGQLNTLGENAVKQQTDADAKAVAEMLNELLRSQQKGSAIVVTADEV